MTAPPTKTPANPAARVSRSKIPSALEGRVTRVPDFHFESPQIGDSQSSSLRAVGLGNTPNSEHPTRTRPSREPQSEPGAAAQPAAEFGGSGVPQLPHHRHLSGADGRRGG